MIDLITVVFEQEIPLIKIQARSIDLYVPPELIGSIYIIINDHKNICDLIDNSWWGKHQQKTRILHYSDFSLYPKNMHGWYSQQLLKLLAAAQAQNNYSYVLDAKTWFIKHILSWFLFDSQGKAHAELMPLFDGFKSTQPFLSEFYSKIYTNLIGPGGVPFPFHTQSLHSMINDIEKKTNKHFDEFFCETIQIPDKITEFTLYSAYVLSQNSFDKLYTYRQPYKVVNIADFQVNEFDKLLAEMQLQTTLTASIHKNLYPNLSQTQFINWCNFLVEKKLLLDLENAQNQLNIYRKGVDNGTGFRL